MTGTRTTCVVVVLLGLLLAGCARRARPEVTAGAAAAGEPVTLLYDVRDLIFRRAPSFPVVYDEHGWPRADESPATAPTREELSQSFVDLVKYVIDTTSWRDHGGPHGSITEEAGQLVVTQTPENHAKLKRLIDQLREVRTTQVTVQSYVIRSPDVWDQIDRAGGKWKPLGDSTQLLYLTAEQMRPLVEGRKQGAGGVDLFTAPRLTLFNGQRAHVIVATETPYVAGYERADVAFEVRKLEPVTKTVHSGVVIDCVPTVSSDRKYVTLTLFPRLSTLRDLKSVPWPEAPADQKDLAMQVPHLTTAAMDVTISVPDGGWVLLRTMPKHQPPGANLAPPEPVLFAFGPTVIEPPKE